ncbi:MULTISPECIES: PilZ domain-containing protein [Anaeromyxobacter]|uniref:PilZ domain-containing protein n=1 Tax=Anaeromyxobacter TaxID=161492 RepID=UPI001F596FFD|nr:MULTISPECIES: PilZ domain-containing protein [unclassified Anaeromyxobacter]
MTLAAPAASRVLVVGSDADVSIALHLHLERAGYAIHCMPGPAELEAIVRAVAPHVLVLLLPAAPDGSWGPALSTAANTAKVGVRVVMVAPSREVVEPLAAVAGAERALARAEVLSRPLVVVERTIGAVPPGAVSSPSPAQRPAPAPAPTHSLADAAGPLAAPRPRTSPVDLMALIDEELVDEPRSRPVPTRVEVTVSLVSEHNFYVGPTRRVDSGGVFIATAMPPPTGTRLQVRLGLADGRRIDLEGEVAFVREKSATIGRQPTGCGVKLFNLPGWAVDAIDRFVLARQPIVYSPQ